MWALLFMWYIIRKLNLVDKMIFILLLILPFVESKNSFRYRLTEYDIRLTSLQDERVYGHAPTRSLGTVQDGDIVGFWRHHYNDGAFEIPVVFDEDDEIEGTNSLSTDDAESILSKLHDMENKLDNVIRFVTDFDKNDFLDGYIRVGSFTSGCWSYVGRLPTQYQPQALNIGTGCDFTDTVEHEFMHTLGFFHEQARPDRDDYVTIHWNNIPTERYINFEIATNIDSRGSPYDRRSVMHYSNYAFASNSQHPSISSTDTSKPLLGSAFTMSSIDMVQLRMLYRCATGVRTVATNCDATCPCRLNEGTCISDDGCDGVLSCYDGTCSTTTDVPTAAPTAAPVTATPTAPVTDAPTAPVTATPTAAASSSPARKSVNIGLAIGLTIMGVAVVVGTAFHQSL